MIPVPGVTIQQAPTPPKFKVQTILVNVPVTVRDVNGEMVHSLEIKDFRVTDNGAEQRITHFEVGGEPISLAVVVETSSRISPLLPQIRKMGILVSQQVTGPTGETAIVGFDDTVQTLLDFTNNSDDVERTMNRLKEGYSGSKLFDAMSKGVELLTNRAAPKAGEPLRRHVMLVLSEAHDAGSEAKLGEVLRRAQLANITIYTVGLSSTPPIYKENLIIMRRSAPLQTAHLACPAPQERCRHRQQLHRAARVWTCSRWRFGPCSTRKTR